MIPARRNWVMFLLSVFLTLTTAALRAQDAHFEVASIRPTESGKQPVTNLDLDASGYFRYHGGPILANGLLVNYIIFAYNIENASLYPAINAQLPGWAQTQRFYVEARAAVEQPSKDDLRDDARAARGQIRS